MTSRPHAARSPFGPSAAGYSLIEILVVLGISAIVMAMAGLQIIEAKPTLQGDGAMRIVLTQVRAAREMAVGERRYMRITFVNPSEVQVVRENVPGPSTTRVSSAALESGVVFTLFPGLPDTPDGFGKAQAVDFGAVSTVKFTPDGMLVDAVGNSVNGTVFFALPGEARSARAVTVLGSTGRIRAYKWDGHAWILA